MQEPAESEEAPSTGDEPITRTLNYLITQRPWTVVLVFFLATAVMLAGLGAAEDREAGAGQFQEDLDEFDALQDMNEQFGVGGGAAGGPPGGGSNPHPGGTTSLTVFVSDDHNVLSQESLLRMIEFEERMHERYGDRIEETVSPASAIAEGITDGEADTLDAQRQVIERLSDRGLIVAIQEADELGELEPVSDDFRPEEGFASVTQMAVTFETAASADSDDDLALHHETRDVVDEVEGFDHGENAYVLSGQIVEDEIDLLLTDTVMLVFPAAVILIVFFLLVAYRDPFDLVLGLTALVMTMLWTFGFMGYAGIPFSDSLIPVFPLLLAVGIDFGVHIINRYREERALGRPVEESMRITTGQLGTAFLIVTVTTIFGFAANLTSPLETLQEFGIIASMGMLFTFLIFGVFLPAGKVGLDSLREGRPIPSFGTTPLGTEGSFLGEVLTVGARLAKIAPVFIVAIALVLGAAGGVAGSDIDTEFSMEEFFPDADRIDTYQDIPEPFKPAEYTFIPIVDHLEEDFGEGWIGTVTVFVDDTDVRSDVALTDVDRALTEPPEGLEVDEDDERRADADSIMDPIESLAEEDEEFAELLDRSDTTGDGVPDRNVDHIYDEVLDSQYGWQAENYLSEDRTSTRIVYDLHVDTAGELATDAATEVADDMRLDATPTGEIVVDQVVIDYITDSALTSLLVAFALTAIFLMLTYRWLEGRAAYGLINLIPILVVVGLLAGSMRAFDIPFTPFNAPILAVSIGLGVDYTVHFMHRFVDEFESGRELTEALVITIQGTGGALTGSMLTTMCGLGVLYLAVIPLIMEFGLLLALGVLYAYLASVLILPSTIVVWFVAERRLLAWLGRD